MWESEEEDSSNVKMLKSKLSMVAIRMLAIVELACWRENIVIVDDKSSPASRA